ncbi:unnamed protein product [Meganyctiphanes norvegica]|uniref:Uncharacterized protein n=1 Tax=Meganyctiphanes norvegica TaxID=48144 RepID=A0AAV2SJA6_MEGNR
MKSLKIKCPNYLFLLILFLNCRGNETNNKWDCKDDSCKYNLVAWLKESFHNHYDRNDGVRANRAPFGLYTDFAWFKIDDIGVGSRHRDAYKEFLDYLQDLDDVWIVSLSTVLEYMKDPMWIEDMEDWMKPFNPPIIPPTSDCPDPRVCTYDNPPFDGANHVDVTICTRPCPRSYPWLQNVDGN